LSAPCVPLYQQPHYSKYRRQPPKITLCKAFLTKYGKIRSRRKTRITVQKQRAIAKAIRKSRSVGLIPFACNVKG
jgi:ribosomal protein S18